MAKSMEKLTGGDGGNASWVPADSYINTVMEASVCHGQLSGVITCFDYDMQACDGDIIQVKYVRARTAQGPMQEGFTGGSCLSATSSTIGTNSVQIYKYGDYDKIAGFAEFETCGSLRAEILNEMAKGLAKKRDELVYDELLAAGTNPNTTFTTSQAWVAVPAYSGSCCTFGFDLYNKIIQAQKHLQGDSLTADYVIMHPDVAQYLYFKEAGTMPNFASTINYGGDGIITTINGMKVIECCNANNGASGATICVVIDSSRAVAEAWGKRPTFSSDYIPECDATKEVVWIYWGTEKIVATAAAGQMEGVVHIKSA